jgi:hypothetical protein
MALVEAKYPLEDDRPRPEGKDYARTLDLLRAH